MPQVARVGSDLPVPLRGGARRQVITTAPAVASDAWFLPKGELLDPTGYRIFRQLAWAGSFEGQSTLGCHSDSGCGLGCRSGSSS